MTYNTYGHRPNRAPGPRNFRSGGRGKRAQPSFSDVSKFVNKAVITEEVEAFIPDHKFSDIKLEQLLQKNITDKGYEYPTPIQDRAIPHILRGEDLVGIANTGTGKTAAFLIPIINKMLKNNNERALIVVPTRELAAQIDEELRAFAKNSGLYSAIFIGGVGMGTQIKELKQKLNFVIGTPGRLMDHINSKRLDLARFGTVVLDESDRMLDMGFIHDVKDMMSRMPMERQTLLFSATITPEIERLIQTLLKNPARISVKTQDVSKNIDQDIIRIKNKTKFEVLRDLLAQENFKKVLVFSRTKHGAEKLSKALKTSGIESESIHGDKNQPARLRALKDFKEEKVKVLVATDVAARGLDIADVSHVINYDLPATYEDYIHRIGRTGRADKKGKALTFIE